jgi:ADP-heptose:LPS heptosyltransferase
MNQEMLVAAPERWDEACFAVPALRALIASGLGVGILCPRSGCEFWQTVPGLAVVDFPDGANARAIAREIGDGWQAALAWEDGPPAVALQKAGIPRRLGPRLGKLVKRLTHPLEVETGPLDHRVRWYLAMVGQLGIPAAKPEFFTPADIGVAMEPRAVLLCPGSDFGPSHEWEPERWLETAEWLLGNGCRVTVAGLDGARDPGRALAESLGEKVRFFRATPMAGTLPLLAAHALVIAADGSLPHLAAHAGAACITLFGPGDPEWRRPLGRRHLVARRHVECAPCFLTKCAMDRRCQLELDTAAVIRMAGGMLAEIQASGTKSTLP